MNKSEGMMGEDALNDRIFEHKMRLVFVRYYVSPNVVMPSLISNMSIK